MLQFLQDIISKMPSIQLSLTQLLIGIGLLVVLGILFVLLMKMRYASNAPETLAQKYGSGSTAFSTVRDKFPEVNAFKLRGSLLLAGLAISLAVIAGSMNYTQTTVQKVYEWEDIDIEEEIEQVPPRTKEPPPPPPPPPPPKIEEVPEEEIEEEDEPIFEDQSIDEDVVMEEIEPVEEAPPPPPPPPPPKKEPPKIFKRVEDMPRFPGCDDLPTNKEKDQCAQQKLLAYMYENIKYPVIARENNIEGRVIVRFVVDTDGSIDDAKVLRGIGAGCDEEALRVVNMMNNMPQKWSPGKQRGKPVKVQFTLPINFKLAN